MKINENYICLLDFIANFCMKKKTIPQPLGPGQSKYCRFETSRGVEIVIRQWFYQFIQKSLIQRKKQSTCKYKKKYHTTFILQVTFRYNSASYRLSVYKDSSFRLKKKQKTTNKQKKNKKKKRPLAYSVLGSTLKEKNLLL